MKRRSGGPGISFFAFQDIITAVVGIFILITLILILELTQRVEAASSRANVNVEEIRSTIELLQLETQRLAIEYERRIESQKDTVGVNRFNRDEMLQELKAAKRAAIERIESAEERMRQLRERIDDEKGNLARLQGESAELEDERDLIAQRQQEIENLVRTIGRLESDEGMIYRDATADNRFLCLLTVESTGVQIQDSGSKSLYRFSGRNWLSDFENWLGRIDSRPRHFLLLVRPSGAIHFDAIRELLADGGYVYGFDVVAKDHKVHLSFEWESIP